MLCVWYTDVRPAAVLCGLVAHDGCEPAGGRA